MYEEFAPDEFMLDEEVEGEVEGADDLPDEDKEAEEEDDDDADL